MQCEDSFDNLPCFFLVNSFCEKSVVFSIISLYFIHVLCCRSWYGYESEDEFTLYNIWYCDVMYAYVRKMLQHLWCNTETMKGIAAYHEFVSNTIDFSPSLSRSLTVLSKMIYKWRMVSSFASLPCPCM